MALDTAQLCPRSHADVPIAVLPTVDARLPVAVNGAVALAAELYHVPLSDLRPIIIYEGVAIRWMVTIQAEPVLAVLENDVLVFVDGTVVVPACLDQLVTLHAIVRPAVTNEVQAHGLPRWGLVQVRIRWKADRGLFSAQAWDDRQRGRGGIRRRCRCGRC